MKRSLIIASQLFQVIVAAQIRKTILSNEMVDLLLINTCDGIRETYDNLTSNSNNLFDNVYIVNHEKFSSKTDKIKKMTKYMLDYNNNYLDLFDFNFALNYSSIYFNHYLHFCCALIIKNHTNVSVKTYRFEEGLGSYLDQYGFVKKSTLYFYYIKEFFLYIFHHTTLAERLKGNLYFYPEFVQFQTNNPTYKIPPIDFNDVEIYNFISQAYDLSEENEFDRKYIFFEENIPGGTIDDFALVMKIAEKIGKENLIVKLHPRRPVDRFSKYGIKVSKSVGIPWEAFLMKYDFSDKIIMTISSSVAFSSRLYFDLPLKTYMLFRVAGGINPEILEKKKYYNYIMSFRKKFNDDNFLIPNSFEDLLKQL